MFERVEKALFAKVEVWVIYFFLILGLIVLIFYGSLVRHELLSQNDLSSESRFPFISRTALFLAEIPSNLKKIGLDYDEKKLPDRFTNISGFIGKPLEEETYLLLTRFDGNINQAVVELIDLRNFEILHNWNPDIDAMNALVNTSNPEFKHLSDWHDGFAALDHPLLMKDGGLLHQSGGVLRKINRCSKMEWFNQEERFHHSHEEDQDGNFWVPTVMFPQYFSKEKVGSDVDDYVDSALTKISPEGKVLFTKSVSEIFVENDMEYLLFSIGNDYERDPLHLNDIQPALSDSKYWKKGDVFLSLRNQSMILQYRPSTNKVISKLTGKTSRQHDVDILDDHRILIFDNNVKNFFPEEKVNGNNKIVIYDFETNQYSYYLDSSIKREDVRTREGGRNQILDNKDLIVEETDYGRTLYYNSDGFLRWQHVNRALDNNIYYISWSRVLYKPSDIKRVQYLLSLSACNNE